MSAAHDGNRPDQRDALERAQAALAEDPVVPMHVLAGCLAHDISSPLTYVRWDVDALARLVGKMNDLAQNPPGDLDWASAIASDRGTQTMMRELPELLEHLRTGLDRLQRLGADLGQLADLEQPTKAVDLREAVSSALRLVRPHLARRAVVEAQLGEIPLTVTSRLPDLIRVVMKLILAVARDRDEGAAPSQLSIVGTQDESWVTLSLTDDRGGMGYAPTSSTVEQLIIAHGGTMTANADSEGTSIEIRLPRGQTG